MFAAFELMTLKGTFRSGRTFPEAVQEVALERCAKQDQKQDQKPSRTTGFFLEFASCINLVIRRLSRGILSEGA